jgi:hypothetical protein
MTTVEIQKMAKTPPVVRLVAIGPGKHVYGTRAMVAGDEFEMSREWADILIRLGKARLADEKPKAAPAAQAMQTEKTEAKAEVKAETAAVANEQREIERLRHEAQRLGIAVDGRWGTVRLNYEIEQKKTHR